MPGCSSAHSELAARAGLQLPMPGGSILTATNIISLSACTDGCSNLSRATRKMVQILFSEQKCFDFFVWHSRNVPRHLAARFGGWVSRPGCFREKKIVMFVEKGCIEVGVNWREGSLHVLGQK